MPLNNFGPIFSQRDTNITADLPDRNVLLVSLARVVYVPYNRLLLSVGVWKWFPRQIYTEAIR